MPVRLAEVIVGKEDPIVSEQHVVVPFNTYGTCIASAQVENMVRARTEPYLKVGDVGATNVGDPFKALLHFTNVASTTRE